MNQNCHSEALAEESRLHNSLIKEGFLDYLTQSLTSGRDSPRQGGAGCLWHDLGCAMQNQ